jgi:hypothetical protein
LVHEDRAVHFKVHEHVEAGLVVVVLRTGQPVRQFSSQGGNYDWNGIAAAVVDIAQGYETQGRSGGRYTVVESGRNADG